VGKRGETCLEKNNANSAAEFSKPSEGGLIPTDDGGKINVHKGEKSCFGNLD